MSQCVIFLDASDIIIMKRFPRVELELTLTAVELIVLDVLFVATITTAVSHSLVENMWSPPLLSNGWLGLGLGNDSVLPFTTNSIT